MHSGAAPSGATSFSSNARPVAAPLVDRFGVRGNAGPKAKNAKTGDVRYLPNRTAKVR